MNSKLALYKELELLPRGSLRPTLKAKWARRLRSWMAHLVQALISYDEPKVKSRLMPDGQTVFDAYDPITHQYIQGASEAEVPIWLEQRNW